MRRKWLDTAIVGFITFIALHDQGAAAEKARMETGWYYPAGSLDKVTRDWKNVLRYDRSGNAYWAWHIAWDFARDFGTEVVAIADGTVVSSKPGVGGFGGDDSPGGALFVRHETADGKPFLALYGHLAPDTMPLGKDAKGNPTTVKAGEPVGRLGHYYMRTSEKDEEGRPLYRDAPHLHFGIYLSDKLPTTKFGYLRDAEPSADSPDTLQGWQNPIPFLERHKPKPAEASVPSKRGAYIHEPRDSRVATPPGVGTPVLPSEEELRGPIDLVFCIDATGSMRDDIDQVKKDAVKLVDELKKKSTSLRIGLVTYRDYSVDGSAHLDINLPLAEDTDKIVAAIQGITVTGGGDDPEDVLDGLMAAIGMDWRPKVAKFIVLMGDAPPKLDSEGKDHTGNTLESVAAAAEAVDPAHVYSLTLSSDTATQEVFTKIAEMTGGQAFKVAESADLPTAIVNTVEFAIKHSKEMVSVSSSPPPPPSPDWQLFALGGSSVAIVVLALLNVQVARRKRQSTDLPEGEWILFVRTEGQKGRSVPLYKVNLTVGRDPRNDVVVTDPKVAEWHLHIGYRSGKVAVSDLRGSKSISVNGQEVQMAYIKPNDRVTIGATSIVFQRRTFSDPGKSVSRERSL